MITRKDARKLAQFYAQAVILAAISRNPMSRQFNDGYAYGIGQTLKTLGASEAELWAIYERAMDHAAEHCPGWSDNPNARTCRPQCHECDAQAIQLGRPADVPMDMLRLAGRVL